MKINKFIFIIVMFSAIKLFGSQVADDKLTITENNYPQMFYSLNHHIDAFNNSVIDKGPGGCQIKDYEKKAQLLLKWSGYGLRYNDVSKYTDEMIQLAVNLIIMPGISENSKVGLRSLISECAHMQLGLIEYLKSKSEIGNNKLQEQNKK